MKYVKIVVLLFVTSTSFAQDLQFYKEDITFSLSSGSFKVDGLYYFCNTGEKTYNHSIYYPFPIDSCNFGPIDSIMVEMDNKYLSFRQVQDKGIYIPLSLEPYKSVTYHISYRQKLLKNTAMYILTSTQTWGRPLENVIYRLYTPNNIEIKHFTYKPDSIQKEGSYTIYYWVKKDFSPAKDMIFEF